MAFIKGINGTFFPLHNDTVNYDYVDIPRKTKRGTMYVYDCKSKNEDPSDIVKWCRRNFGARGDGWDFMLTGGKISVEIWKSEYITMYEMWKR